jgi:uncharacterized protein (DUF302 family)
MITLDPAASLYVPLRVLVFEDTQGVTHVAYDQPSNLLGTLGNDGVTEIARTLDWKMHELAERAAGRAPAPVRPFPRGNAMTESRFPMEHVRMTADKPFADVQAAFEQRLGRFEPTVYKELARGGDPNEARARIEAMAGPSGFMLFSTNDHGSLLRIVGQQRKAVQYVVGNPLFAVEMTRHAIGASLYAPLRVLIYEADNGKTCIEYDRPSSLFGQFGDERVGKVAAALDLKLEELAAAATR